MIPPQADSPRAIFLDLDGTLCVSDQAPTPAALSAIDAARANGHKVFLSTGRAISMIPPSILSIPWDGIVSGLGARIEVEGRVVYDHPYTKEEVCWLVELFHSMGIVFLAETGSLAYMEISRFHALGLDAGTGVNREVASLVDAVQQKQIREWTDYQGEPIYNIAFLSADDDDLAVLRPALEQRYAVVIHPPEFPGYITDLELVRHDINKGLALSMVCDVCGIPVSRSIAFGDSMNDREMFAAAGLAVAMGNGDVDIKALADWICGPVQEDGLADAFRTLGLV